MRYIIYKFEECKGCVTDREEACRIKFIEKLRAVCPCLNCIVRVMCSRTCYRRNSIYSDIPWLISQLLEGVANSYDDLEEKLRTLETALKKKELQFEVSPKEDTDEL